MIIKCPHCGPREVSEFTYVGDATVKRPAGDDPDMKKWAEYVFMRDNPRGAHIEHWQHTSGCRAFLKVQRNTVSHEIAQVVLEGVWAAEDKS